MDRFYAQNLNRIKPIQALFCILSFHSFLISRIAGTIPSKPRKIGMLLFFRCALQVEVHGERYRCINALTHRNSQRKYVMKWCDRKT